MRQRTVFRSAFLALWALGLGAQDVKLQVLSTTDLHGHVMPEDSFSMQPADKGWAKLATLIKRKKAENPNTLMIDSGDTIQGEPINYVRTFVRRDQPEPSIAIMNALGYSAMALGNHEFNFGLETLREVEKQAHFPFLSANTVDAKSGKPAFPSYVKRAVAGLNVVIVGFTTPLIPKWEEPKNYAGLRFDDIVETAKVLIPRIRDKEKADVLIVTMHSGLGRADGTRGDENAALRLAEQVPGIDVILTGHTHQPISVEHKGVVILQAQAHGRALGTVELDLQKDKGGRYRVVASRAQLIKPAADTPLDPEVLQVTAELRDATNRYLNTFATNLLVDLDARWTRMEDTPLMQLIHSVQREATGAQLSAATISAPKAFIPKGATSVRQFYALLPYENQIARIRINGDQLKRYLEHAARAYNFSFEPELFNREIAFFDFDQVDGATYAIDLGKPVGARILDLKVNGQAVTPDQSFTMAITTYRLRGGGGYMSAMGFQGTVEFITPALQRNLLLQYVLARPSLMITADNNWRTIPSLDRERVMLQNGH
jgi:2',3'-cyclic-nucleotide 2'-phosphodiesterase / 3'-nucleotidase